MWNNVQRSDWCSNRVRTRWWCVQAEGPTHQDRKRLGQVEPRCCWASSKSPRDFRRHHLRHLEPYPLYRVRQKSSTKQHELTHLPCRSWCRHCVRAKDKDGLHHGSSPGGVSKFATNYIVIGDEGTSITILAGYDELLPTWYLVKTRVTFTQKEHSQPTYGPGFSCALRMEARPLLIQCGRNAGAKPCSREVVSSRGFLFGWRFACFCEHTMLQTDSNLLRTLLPPSTQNARHQCRDVPTYHRLNVCHLIVLGTVP